MYYILPGFCFCLQDHMTQGFVSINLMSTAHMTAILRSLLPTMSPQWHLFSMLTELPAYFLCIEQI